jgi:hypothetical protein
VPARNRVLPAGDIVAVAGRGAWMGNRGCLHIGLEVVRPSRSRAWLVCRLSFRDRRVPQWAPRRYTPLFFLDEAVAFAAGHRPCGECRRHDYLRFRDTAGAATVAELDARLQAERRAGPVRRSWDLPDGSFVRTATGPALVLGDALIGWDDRSYRYTEALPRPRVGTVEVLTPPTTVAVLRNGFRLQIDAGAVRAAGQPRAGTAPADDVAPDRTSGPASDAASA